jgi:Icc protein
MRIIQITDPHINIENEIVNRVDTKKNFIRVLEKAKEFSPDIFVFTGDLSFNSGSTNIYYLIKEILTQRNISNYYIIGGNHDDVHLLAEVFDYQKFLKGSELFYSIHKGIILLDTIKGFCSSEQLKWFEETLKSITEPNPIIFMHHPPFKAGVPHMDGKYAFEQSEIFHKICRKIDKPVTVFCGHYHNEISMIKGNVNVFITPSTYLQIGKKTEAFEIDHYIPGFRIIDICDNNLKTNVIYVFDK